MSKRFILSTIGLAAIAFEREARGVLYISILWWCNRPQAGVVVQFDNSFFFKLYHYSSVVTTRGAERPATSRDSVAATPRVNIRFSSLPAVHS